MIPLEILCGALVLVLANWLTTGHWRGRLLLVLVILTLARVHVAGWQRLPWRDHWRSIAAAPLTLEGKPLVFLTFAPSAFVALNLPPDARYVGPICGELDLCARDSGLTRQLRRELAEVPPYSLYAVVPDGPSAPDVAGLAAYGLRLGAQCRRLAVAEKVFRICDVLRQPPRMPASPLRREASP